MSSSFTDGKTAVLPNVVDGYRATRPSQHVFHSVMDDRTSATYSVEDVYARPAGLRTGTLTAVFADYAPAARLHTMLSGVTPITFADSDRPEISMVFLADGSVSIEQSAARGAWIITIDYHEVRP